MPDDLILDPHYKHKFETLPSETQNIIKHYLTTAKRGRKCCLKPEMLPKLLILCSEGCTKAQICASLGFAERTLDRLLTSKLKNEAVMEHLEGQDDEKRSLLEHFRLTYRFGRTLARSYYDQIAKFQLNNPDKAFNDRLYLAHYRRMFANNSESVLLEAMPELITAITENDFQAMNKTVLTAVASGSICTQSAESLVGTLKKAADMTVLVELKERIESLEKSD